MNFAPQGGSKIKENEGFKTRRKKRLEKSTRVLWEYVARDLARPYKELPSSTFETAVSP